MLPPKTKFFASGLQLLLVKGTNIEKLFKDQGPRSFAINHHQEAIYLWQAGVHPSVLRAAWLERDVVKAASTNLPYAFRPNAKSATNDSVDGLEMATSEEKSLSASGHGG